MTKDITFSLYFSDHEPRIIGHVIFGDDHYQIVGIRRSSVRADLTAHRVRQPSAQQGDLFDDNSSASGARKRDLL
jgi:hypothetical protein